VITVITGDNTFQNERNLARIINDTTASAEKIAGSELELRLLPDLLMGGTLFASDRLVIIKNLSENKPLWNDFDRWIERVSDDIHLVLLETKPDKRTKTFKTLQKAARVVESKLWTERDTPRAEQWVAEEAETLGLRMDKKSIHLLVTRVGIDQWALFDALEKLSLLGKVTTETIEEYIEANPAENVFAVFDAILKGDIERVYSILATLKLTEEPYRLFGLLTAQLLQLMTLAVSGKPSAEVAKDIGVHPFALSKLNPYVRQYDQARLRTLLSAFNDADENMKTSAIDPWLCIEEAAFKAASVK